jgi:hypothetical protein
MSLDPDDPRDFEQIQIDLSYAQMQRDAWRRTAEYITTQREELRRALEEFVVVLAAEDHDEPQPSLYYEYLDNTVKPLLKKLGKPFPVPLKFEQEQSHE